MNSTNQRLAPIVASRDTNRQGPRNSGVNQGGNGFTGFNSSNTKLAPLHGGSVDHRMSKTLNTGGWTTSTNNNSNTIVHNAKNNTFIHIDSLDDPNQQDTSSLSPQNKFEKRNQSLAAPSPAYLSNRRQSSRNNNNGNLTTAGGQPQFNTPTLISNNGFRNSSVPPRTGPHRTEENNQFEPKRFQFYNQYNIKQDEFRQGFMEHMQVSRKKINQQLTELVYSQIMDSLSEGIARDLPSVFSQNKQLWCGQLIRTKKLQKVFSQFTDRIQMVLEEELHHSGDLAYEFMHYPQKSKKSLSSTKNATSRFPGNQVLWYPERAPKRLDYTVNEKARQNIRKAAEQFKQRNNKDSSQAQLLGSEINSNKPSSPSKKKKVPVSKALEQKKPILTPNQQEIKDRVQRMENITSKLNSNNMHLNTLVEDVEQELADLSTQKKTRQPGQAINNMLQKWSEEEVMTDKQLQKYANEFWMTLAEFQQSLEQTETALQIRLNETIEYYEEKIQHNNHRFAFRVEALENALIETKIKLSREANRAQMELAEMESTLLNTQKSNSQISSVLSKTEDMQFENNKVASLIAELKGAILGLQQDKQQLEQQIKELVFQAEKRQQLVDGSVEKVYTALEVEFGYQIILLDVLSNGKFFDETNQACSKEDQLLFQEAVTLKNKRQELEENDPQDPTNIQHMNKLQRHVNQTHEILDALKVQRIFENYQLVVQNKQTKVKALINRIEDSGLLNSLISNQRIAEKEQAQKQTKQRLQIEEIPEEKRAPSKISFNCREQNCKSQNSLLQEVVQVLVEDDAHATVNMVRTQDQQNLSAITGESVLDKNSSTQSGKIQPDLDDSMQEKQETVHDLNSKLKSQLLAKVKENQKDRAKEERRQERLNQKNRDKQKRDSSVSKPKGAKLTAQSSTKKQADKTKHAKTAKVVSTTAANIAAQDLNIEEQQRSECDELSDEDDESQEEAKDTVDNISVSQRSQSAARPVKKNQKQSNNTVEKKKAKSQQKSKQTTANQKQQSNSGEQKAKTQNQTKKKEQPQSLNKLKRQQTSKTTGGGIFSPRTESTNNKQSRSPRQEENNQTSSRQLSKEETSGERFDTDSLKTQPLDTFKEYFEEMESKFTEKFQGQLDQINSELEHEPKLMNMKFPQFEELHQTLQQSLAVDLESKDYMALFDRMQIDLFLEHSNQLISKYLRKDQNDNQELAQQFLAAPNNNDAPKTPRNKKDTSGTTSQQPQSPPSPLPRKIKFADMISVDMDTQGNLLGFKLRPEICKIFFYEDESQILNVQRALKNVAYLNRLVLQTDEDFLLAKKKSATNKVDFECQVETAPTVIVKEIEVERQKTPIPTEESINNGNVSKESLAQNQEQVVAAEVPQLMNETFEQLQNHIIQILTRENPKRQAYYRMVWKEQKLNEFMEYKMPGVYEELPEGGVDALTNEQKQEEMTVKDYFEFLFKHVDHKIQTVWPREDRKYLGIKDLLWLEDDTLSEEQVLTDNKATQTIKPKEEKKQMFNTMTQTPDNMLPFKIVKEEVPVFNKNDIGKQIEKIMNDEVIKTVEALDDFVQKVKIANSLELRRKAQPRTSLFQNKKLSGHKEGDSPLNDVTTTRRDGVEIKVSSQKNKKIAKFREEINDTIKDIDQEIKIDAEEKSAAKERIKQKYKSQFSLKKMNSNLPKQAIQSLSTNLQPKIQEFQPQSFHQNPPNTTQGFGAKNYMSSGEQTSPTQNTQYQTSSTPMTANTVVNPPSLMNPVYMKERQAPSNPFKQNKLGQNTKTPNKAKSISVVKSNIPSSLICVKLNENNASVNGDVNNMESESLEGTNQGSRTTKRVEMIVNEGQKET